MAPKMTGVDHLHVYVSDRPNSKVWYETVLGFQPIKAYADWVTAKGPLMLEDPTGNVHLAMFETKAAPTSIIAFGSTGEEFLAWKKHLESHDLKLRIADHGMSWSMYFEDPDGNSHEITTYETKPVAQALS